jgi:hypothetical protein
VHGHADFFLNPTGVHRIRRKHYQQEFRAVDAGLDLLEEGVARLELGLGKPNRDFMLNEVLSKTAREFAVLGTVADENTAGHHIDCLAIVLTGRDPLTLTLSRNSGGEGIVRRHLR